ncbi:programmed cell death protein 2-like isoform X3 [Anolis sagrei]|uniref:programmed cell death protein 2-like isoform X3 n=1 Tax=Anolis sagrei TaxID=38937 RepID=UPI00352129C6
MFVCGINITQKSLDESSPSGDASGDCIPSVVLAPPCCGICSSALVHLLQISCPLEGSPFQRLIHVFACAEKSCWGKSESWKVLRSQYLQEIVEQGSEVKQKEECAVAASDWCEGADDWGEDGDGMEPIARHSPGAAPEVGCAMQLQVLSLRDSPVLHPVSHSHEDNSNNNPRDGPDGPRSVPAFRPYYISVVDEADYLGYQDVDHAQKLLQEYQRKEGLALEQLVSESCASGGYEEKYEKSGIGKRDRVFHRFMKRISSCPEQLLRSVSGIWNCLGFHLRKELLAPESSDPVGRIYLCTRRPRSTPV